MHRRLNHLLPGIILLSFGHLSAQTSKPGDMMALPAIVDKRNPKELTIGERVPDIVFDEVMNYPAKKARLSDFTAKLTILDFWSTSCSACVELFPHMQALKDEFGDQIQIVLINGKTSIWHDNEDKISRLLEKQQGITGQPIHLPIVLNSAETDKAFPWASVPHEVWLDSNRTIIAITGAAEVSSGYIKGILNGSAIPMHIKKDVVFDIQYRTLQELVYQSRTNEFHPESSSILVKGLIDGLNGEGFWHADVPHPELYTRWYITNEPLMRIYQIAYNGKMSLPRNQIIITTKDSILFRDFITNDSLFYKYAYSYDLIVPPISLRDLMIFAQRDLERNFRISITKTKRRVKCFVLRNTDSLFSALSKGGSERWEITSKLSKKLVRNYPIHEMIKKINHYSDVPLIDETNLNKNVDMDLPDNLWDTDALVMVFRRTGLRVTEEYRVMDVVIIKDKQE
jgi:thiol-disulfide isomerase/thioredoxin